MKASKFTDAQKAFILKQGADGHPVAEICRKAGISEATYFNWKKNGPVAVLRQSCCLFGLIGVRMLGGSCLPMPNASGAGYRSR